MARQIGHIFITGTIDDVTYYKMYGTYYARMKSTLSRKKVLTSPRFALTRMHANQLAEASKIASRLYRGIPKEERKVQLYRAIVGEAKVLLASGKDKESVMEILSNALNPETKPAKRIQSTRPKQKDRAYVSKAGRLVWKTSYPNSKKTEYNNRLEVNHSINGTILSIIQSTVPHSEMKVFECFLE